MTDRPEASPEEVALFGDIMACRDERQPTLWNIKQLNLLFTLWEAGFTQPGVQRSEEKAFIDRFFGCNTLFAKNKNRTHGWILKDLDWIYQEALLYLNQQKQRKDAS